MTDDYLSSLNEQQRRAVEAVEGPVLVLAGAGSGKTRVITSRIIHLIRDCGVPAYRILAMTFTNKAAEEMKDRVGSDVNVDIRDLTVSTFHSFCARFLRREIDHLNRDGRFAIFDVQDQTACLKRVIRNLKLKEKDYPPAVIRNKISRMKNSGNLDTDVRNRNLNTIIAEYQHQMELQNALDFDDLLLFTCDILRRFPECRCRYSERFVHLLVDEYQDTNWAQLDLLKSLVEVHGNICVVGDEDQSIYGWRGADIHNILDFSDHFADTKVFQLERNYRSTQAILDYANQAISLNKQRHPKRLWTDLGTGEQVQQRSFYREIHEAEFIAEKAMRLHVEDGRPWNSVAVLFRANYLSRNLEEAFRKRDIPFQLVGGVKFYERKEIKDLLSYARICINPSDWVAFCRALATPPRGLGAKSLDVLATAFKSSQDIFTSMNRVVAGSDLHPSRLKKLIGFQRLLVAMRDAIDDLTPSTWIQELIQALDYQSYVEHIDKSAAEFRWANVQELLLALAEMESRGLESLAEFMDHCALISDQDQHDKRRKKVSLMTVHAAKGLEFDTVFVMGLEDGVFPNQRSLNESAEAAEEERRLFYVALTRAKRRLVLTHAHRRQTFGSFANNPPSRFLLGGGPRRPTPKPRSSPDLGRQLDRIKSQLMERDVAVEFPTHLTSNLGVGDRVKHPQFGTGQVVNMRGRGPGRKISVHFSGFGVKQFVLDRAGLEKVIDMERDS